MNVWLSIALRQLFRHPDELTRQSFWLKNGPSDEGEVDDDANDKCHQERSLPRLVPEEQLSNPGARSAAEQREQMQRLLFSTPAAIHRGALVEHIHDHRDRADAQVDRR